MKIFDCFMFFNELDLLELRLMEVYDYVDYFVLVEGNKTHTGHPKEFIFEQNKERYSKWLDKIIHVKIEDFPEYVLDRPALLENFHRNQIIRGLVGKVEVGDKIMVSDVDEIPNMEMIKPYFNQPGWFHFKCDLFYYYVNTQCDCGFGGVVMAEWKNFRNPQRLRMMAIRKQRWTEGSDNVFMHSGWHYSYLCGGDPERVMFKAKNIFEGHDSAPIVGTTEEVTDKIKNHKDLYNRRTPRYHQTVVDISNNKPKHLDEWLKKYPEYYYHEK